MGMCCIECGHLESGHHKENGCEEMEREGMKKSRMCPCKIGRGEK